VVKNAQALAKILRAGGPRLVANGTDNHMTLVDLTAMNMSGKETEEVLGQANIVINRNAILFDQPP